MATAATYIRERATAGAAIRIAALCVVAGLAVIAAYSVLWHGAPYRGTDTAEYMDAARSLAAGIDTPQPRTPGFPLYLLAVGTGRGFFLISLVLHLASIGMLLAMLRSMGVSRRLLLLFAAVAVLPPFVQKDAYLLTEGLTEFLVVAGFAALWRAAESKLFAALSGLSFTLAAITRPQNQLVPVLMGALLVACYGWTRARRNLPALLLPAVVLMGGLMVHNQVKFGYSGLTYLLGQHLGTRTVTLYDKIPDPQVREILVSTRNDAYVHRNPYWTTWYTRPELMRLKGFTPVQLAKYMQGIHLRLILGHPLAYLEEVARAFFHFWSPDLPEATSRSAPVQLVSMLTQVAVCLAFWLAFVLWAGLAMGRLFLAVPPWLPTVEVRFLYVSALALVGYTALLCTALDIGEPRYRGPVDLLILFVVVVTAHHVVRARRTALHP